MSNVQNNTNRISTLFQAKAAFYGAKLAGISLFMVILMMGTSESAFAIVGGTEAVHGEQEWMVGVALADEQNGFYAQFCGGTLISSEWVLTAAHCTVDENNVSFEASELDVIIGRTQLTSNRGDRIAIAQIIVHSGFDLTTYNHDIALLRLVRPVDSIKPVHLGTAADLATAINPRSPSKGAAQVYGWGVTQDGSATDNLKTATLPLVTRGGCQVAYSAYGIELSDNMVCAGFEDGGTDSCVGDSGGPLVHNINGAAVQIGLVSWGLECGAAQLYGVYTNVVNYTNWITFQMDFYG